MGQMKWCKTCVLPDSRPDLAIGPDGICNACRAHARRTDIDWESRAAAFTAVATNAKARGAGYDCLIPVSGGKDSTWQVVKCLEHGLRPLAVTWRPPGRTAIGQRNLDNLISLGVDHIDYSFNPKVERAFMLKAFERFGTPALPMHMGVYNMPLTLAYRFDIPLVVWGENSADEYGSHDEVARGFALTEAWLNRHGVTHGTGPKDWIDSELSERDLTPYFRPRGQDLVAKGITGIFLGYYFPWDPETSLDVAARHGFERLADGPKTGLYDYAGIDDDFISVHHHIKWYKFGFTRLFDHLALEIRNGRMTRQQAIHVIRERGDQTPYADIDRFCEFLGIDRRRFGEIVERFRNPKVWQRENGVWKIDGFLISDWTWC
jgi:N-acetyl sugar amidotransferase